MVVRGHEVGNLVNDPIQSFSRPLDLFKCCTVRMQSRLGQGRQGYFWDTYIMSEVKWLSLF